MSICQFQYSVISCAIYLHRCSHAPYQYLAIGNFSTQIGFDGAYSFQVKLGEPGYKERYYAEKFGEEESKLIDDIRRDVVSCLL